MVYPLRGRTTLGKYTRIGRNHLEKSRWRGMTSTGAWGTLFTIERALISSLSNGLERQLTKVIPVGKLDSDDRASSLVMTPGSRWHQEPG